MQNKYVADIGDYSKYGMLRSLLAGEPVGIAWWLNPDEGHNNDGRHRKYLEEPQLWRQADPVLFDCLRRINSSHLEGTVELNVRAIEVSGILPNSKFFSQQLPDPTLPVQSRETERSGWFTELKRQLSGCSVLFADPDNGLAPIQHNAQESKANKWVFIQEVCALTTDFETIIVYHHLNRMRGGHALQIQYWFEKLVERRIPVVGAVCCRAYSPRAYFVCTCSSRIERLAREFSCTWPKAEWHSPREHHASS